MQVYYRRVFGLSTDTITAWLAIIVPTGGLIGSSLGGVLGDLWAKVCFIAGLMVA